MLRLLFVAVSTWTAISLFLGLFWAALCSRADRLRAVTSAARERVTFAHFIEPR